MYDTFSSGDQVKCFYVPCFYYSNSNYYGDYMLGYMGGSLRHYSKNFEVPTKTLWYKYLDDFVIVDTMNSDYDDNNSLPSIHIIKDKKYITTVNRCIGLLNYFDSPFRVITKYGDTVSLNKDTVEDSVNELNVFIKEHGRIVKSKNAIFRAHSKEKSEFFSYVRNFNKKTELETDKEYIRLRDNYEKICNLEDEQISKLSDGFNSKYYPDVDKRESLLGDIGAYLYCYDLYNGLEEDNEKYIVMYKEFVRRVEENNVFIEEYFEWNNTEEKTMTHLKEIWEIMFNKVKERQL